MIDMLKVFDKHLFVLYMISLIQIVLKNIDCLNNVVFMVKMMLWQWEEFYFVVFNFRGLWTFCGRLTKFIKLLFYFNVLIEH